MSLDYDHYRYFEVSTPSLGITGEPGRGEQLDDRRTDRGESFNSLSRDHFGPTLYLAGREEVFQLPLSGSQERLAKYLMKIKLEVSTPSLGITSSEQSVTQYF